MCVPIPQLKLYFYKTYGTSVNDERYYCTTPFNIITCGIWKLKQEIMKLVLILLVAISYSDIAFPKVNLKTPRCQSIYSTTKRDDIVQKNSDSDKLLNLKLNSIRGGFSDTTIVEVIQRWTSYVIDGFSSLFRLKRYLVVILVYYF